MTPSVVLVGVQGYGARHAATLQQYAADGRVQVVGIVDPYLAPGSFEWSAGTAPRLFDRLAPALAMTKPDAVVIATPPHTHAPLAKQAIDAGVAVYLEKPVTPLLQDLDALLALTPRRRVEVGFQQLPQSLRAAEVALQVLGEPVTRVSMFSAVKRSAEYYGRSRWAGRWFLDGAAIIDGPLFNPLAHIFQAGISVARRLDSEWRPIRIEGSAWSARAIDGDDTTSLRISSERGPSLLAVGTTAADEIIYPTVRLHTASGHADIVDGGLALEVTLDGRTTRHVVEPEGTAPLAVALEPEGPVHPALSLEASRDFTLIANAAVQAIGSPHGVPWPHGVDGESMVIAGIAARTRQCVDQNRLYAELAGADVASIDVRPDFRGLTDPRVERTALGVELH